MTWRWLVCAAIVVGGTVMVTTFVGHDEGSCGFEGKECHPTTIGSILVVSVTVVAFLAWAWVEVRQRRRR